MAPTPTLGLSSFLEVIIPGNFSASQLPWAHTSQLTIQSASVTPYHLFL